MKQGAVSQTAIGTAAGRAVESRRRKTDRLFRDPFAIRLLPPVLRAIVRLLTLPGLGAWLLAKRDRRLPGIMGNLLCRTRHIDDATEDAIRDGVDQVVILGAGLDSRPCRIPGMTQCRVFEVDHPTTQAWKRKRLSQILGALPPHVTFVPVDFNRQALDTELDRAGFQPATNTFFIWEGVTQYITADAVDATFRFVSEAAAPGSRIVFTYIHRGIIDGAIHVDGSEEILSETQRRGEPWEFGIIPEELASHLAARKLTLVEDAGAAEYRCRYLEPVGRKMTLFEGERTALAVI